MRFRSLFAAGLAGILSAACAETDGGIPLEVAGVRASVPAGWSIEQQKDEDAMLVLRRGEDLYGVIFLHRVEDEQPATALDRYKRRLIRQGLALRPSGERREERIERFYWLSEPVIAEASGETMVGIVSVHRLGEKAIGSMFMVANAETLDALVEDYRRLVESMGRGNAPQAATAEAAAEEGQNCRMEPRVRITPRYGGCIGAMCSPSWGYDTQIVPQRVCR
ncbi:MAG: hypothetical protein KatS3mg125_0059 [Lysobacterales bacterium]|jgi:hypothetical protein|nr:MAG: hypothetical protein KatS3mg125_0059 [Xanthomonadales bacterium]